MKQFLTLNLQKRNAVPSVAQSFLVGCATAGVGIVDAEQRRTSDGDWPTVPRQPLIDLQLALCLGASGARCFDQRVCGRQTAQVERRTVGDGHRVGLSRSAGVARSRATRRIQARRLISVVTRLIGRHPQKFAACASALGGLKTWAQQGGGQLVYYDEAGFSASPPVQRAWSPVGYPNAVTPAHRQRVTVMGALDFAGKRLHHALAVATVNRETFIDLMEALIPRIATPVPTFIILDNARIHYALDDSHTLRWMKEFNIFFLCYLPA